MSDTSDPEPYFDALAGAAESVRQLISHIRKTKAPADVLEEVEREATRLAARLAPYDHPGPYAQRRLVLGEGHDMLRDTDDPVEYFPYSPIIGPLNPIAPPVDFKLAGRELHATHSFDAQYNGPPASVHGGVIALVFDELLGSLGAILDLGGFTGTLKIVYRSLTPIEHPIRMRSGGGSEHLRRPGQKRLCSFDTIPSPGQLAAGAAGAESAESAYAYDLAGADCRSP